MFDLMLHGANSLRLITATASVVFLIFGIYLTLLLHLPLVERDGKKKKKKRIC